MSCSGGEAALVADMAIEKNVRFPPFDICTGPRVAATLNEYVAIDNPLDYHTFIWNDEAKLTATFSAVLAGGYDVAMLILDIPTSPKMRPDTWLVTAKPDQCRRCDEGPRRHGRLASRVHAAGARRRTQPSWRGPHDGPRRCAHGF
jgi:hypothetical protein